MPIREPDSPGQKTLLAAAAAVGNGQAVKHYLKEGGDPIGGIPSEYFDCDRPMEAAASTGKTLIVRKLLEKAGLCFARLGKKDSVKC
jgi:hypothetical protein